MDQSWSAKKRKWQLFFQNDKNNRSPTEVKKLLRLLRRVHKLHERSRQPFTNLSQEEAEELLSDPSRSVTLCSLSAPDGFSYVGRSVFKKLLERMKRLFAGNIRLQGPSGGDYICLHGPSGRGKSYVLAALACYLRAFTQYKPVYLVASRYLADPYSCLRSALLLTFADEPTKQERCLSKDMEWLIFLCRIERNLILLYDDDVKGSGTGLSTATFPSRPTSAEEKRLETETALHAARPRLFITCGVHPPRYMLKSTFHLGRIEIEQRFNKTEVRTWLACMNKRDADLQDLYFYTAYIPECMAKYFSCKEEYVMEMENRFEMFVLSLWSDLDAAALVEEAFQPDYLRGFPVPRPVVYMEPHLIYEEEDNVFILPFLEAKLRPALIGLRQDLKERDPDRFSSVFRRE